MAISRPSVGLRSGSGYRRLAPGRGTKGPFA